MQVQWDHELHNGYRHGNIHQSEHRFNMDYRLNGLLAQDFDAFS